MERLEDRRMMAVLDDFLTNEHVDLQIRYTNGVWGFGPYNSDSDLVISNEHGLLYGGDSGTLDQLRPTGSQFNFIGVPAGATYYRLPQNQDPSLIYLGASGTGVANSVNVDRYNPSVESKGRVGGTGRWLKASLVDVVHTTPSGAFGNGIFSIWQSDAGGPIVFLSNYNDNIANPNPNGLDTTDGITVDDAFWVLRGGHNHYNYGFSQPGRYEVTFVVSAYLGDDNQATPNVGGYSQSEEITLYFSIMSVGELHFDASSYQVDESTGLLSIDVLRLGGRDGRIQTNFKTELGTALPGVDFSSVSGTLVFEDLEVIKTITIPILDDSTAELNESFTLILENPAPIDIQDYLINFENDSNGLLGSTSSTTITILDNDSAPTNTPPTITAINDQTIDEDTSTPFLEFTIGDTQTAISDLVLTVQSSNLALIPVSNIEVTGTGATRTVRAYGLPDQFGASTITLQVTDGGGLSATEEFIVTVLPINDAPRSLNVSPSAIFENLAMTSDRLWGELTAVDVDPGDVLSYSLVTGTGDADNALFSISGSSLYLKQGTTLDYEQKPTFLVRLQVEDAAGAVHQTAMELQVLDLPEIESIQFGDGTAQRSRVSKVVVAFDSPVSIAADAFSFRRRGASGGLVDTSFTTETIAGKTIATLAFSGSSVVGGSLIDGNYDLAIDGSKIQRLDLVQLDADKDGTPGGTSRMGEKESDAFFRLFGDTSGDRIVTVSEFNEFRSAFGKSLGHPSFNSLYDFDGNGIIAVNDFNEFRSRFGKRLNF